MQGSEFEMLYLQSKQKETKTQKTMKNAKIYKKSWKELDVGKKKKKRREFGIEK